MDWISSETSDGVYLWSTAAVLLLLTPPLLLYKYYFKVTNKKLPPGPRWALPLLGHLLQLGSKPHLTFSKWRTQYGPIFYLKIANMNTVVVGDAKLVKELYSKEVTTGRMQNPILDVHGAGLGIGITHGRHWMEQRSFAIKSLNGLSKGGTLEGILVEEAARLVKYLEGRANLPLVANGIAMPAIMNSAWRLMFGEDHDWTQNPDLEHVKTITQVAYAVNKMVETGTFFLPWLRHVIPEWCGYNSFVKGSLKLKGATEGIVSRILADPTNSANNFVGQYLSRIEGERDPGSSFFHERGKKNLFQTTSDIFVAATDTTSSTMDFALLYLSQHARVQVELQREVDLVIGSRRPPSLSDKLPYMEAVIQETLRKSSIFALGFPHRALEDLEFQGYFIPKETTLLVDLWGILHDPEVWGDDPHAFRPERWLNEERSGLVRVDSFIPFLVGKRMCIGESMARNQVTLFLASLMQKFSLEPDNNKGKQVVDLDDVVAGFFLKPKPFRVVFKARGLITT